MLDIKYKIWLEQDGKAFGKGPFLLLKGVKESGSLSEAAKTMGMSYNKAYNLVRLIEGRLGFRLIESKSGGTKGGGSVLTPEAEKLMQTYGNFYMECERSIREIFMRHFEDKDSIKP